MTEREKDAQALNAAARGAEKRLRRMPTVKAFRVDKNYDDRSLHVSASVVLPKPADHINISCSVHREAAGDAES